MVTKFQENIYNCFLACSRTAQNKPFKLRKQFDDLSEEVRADLSKIESLLKRLNYIKLNDFIVAPFKVFPDETYFELKFYSSQRAIKAYTLYIKQIMDSDIDSDEFLKRIIDGIKWINEFCLYNNSDIADYLHITHESMPAFITHLKERRMPLYVLFYYDDFEKIMRSQDPDVIKFMFGNDFLYTLPNYRTKYMSSSRCKLLVNKAINQIKRNK